MYGQNANAASMAGQLVGGQYNNAAVKEAEAYRQAVAANNAPTAQGKRVGDAALDEMMNRLGMLSDRVYRVERLSDRICGAEPEANGGGAAVNPVSFADKIAMVIQILGAVDDRLCHAVNRLETFV